MPSLGLRSDITSSSPTSAADFPDTYSIDFDGTDDYVNIPQIGTNFPSGADPRTISCWVKRPSGGGSPQYGYLWKYGYINNQQQFAIGIWKNTTNLHFSGYSNDIDTTIDIDDTDWHHIVVTFDGTTLKVYKDAATPAESTAGSSDWTNLNTLTSNDTFGGFMIGRRENINPHTHTGNINDVAIWDVVLSAADVTAIYNSGAPNDLTDSGSYETDRTGGLVGYWKFEEGSGTTATDSSDEGNDGTLTNGAAYSTEVPS